MWIAYFNRMRKLLRTSLLLACLAAGNAAWAQQKAETHAPQEEPEITTSVLKKGLKMNLTPEGTSSLTFGLGLQTWFRYMEMNPGTVDAQTGKPIKDYSDFALRRMRVSMAANVEGKFFVFSQFGITSQSFYEKPLKPIYFHDFFAKFKIANNLYIGSGLHMWNGLSRLSQVSYVSGMVFDNPGFNFPNVNVDDQLVRQIGVFVQGQSNRFEYSLSVNKPMEGSDKLYKDSDLIENGMLKPGIAYNQAYNRKHSSYNLKGYAAYNFLTKEKLGLTPFKAMTYLGKAGTILNLGAGFQYLPNSGVEVKEGASEVTVVDRSAISVDLFYEQPFKNGSVLTAYAAYYRYNFGQNYLNSGGTMGGFAQAGQGVMPQGAGISRYIFGTGNVYYTEAQYILPQFLKSPKQLAVFGTVALKDLNGLGALATEYDAGMHYYIMGHAAKLTLQYSSRPVFAADKQSVLTRKGIVAMQMQFKI